MSTIIIQRGILYQCRRSLVQSSSSVFVSSRALDLESSFLHSRYYYSTSNTTTNDESDNNKNNKNNKLFYYEAPMGGLISRLKIVSITSCGLSLVGLPLFVFLKNGDLPNASQVGMGGIALFAATGSTLALHFVFGPYALTIEEIVMSDTTNKDDMDDHDKETLLKATTRSVFGWKNEIVFDPSTDVMPYTGSRPFANFLAKDTALYAHPELLDETMKQKLLFPPTTKSTTMEEEPSQASSKNEGLPPSSSKKIKDDDDFF